MKSLDAKHYILQLQLNRDDVPDFSSYPFLLDAVNNLQALKFHPAVTFFVGENGSGKSTLLEAIAVAWGFNAEGGSKNFNFATRPSHSCLHEYLTMQRGLMRPRDGYFLRAESFFNVATHIEEMDREPAASPPIITNYGGNSLHEQSHGESFFRLLTERFGGEGLYILDEPEAALSPSRQMAMLTHMHELIRQGSQFIIATHSPIIMAYPNACIYTLNEQGIVPTEYEDTEHFAVTRQFINNHKGMLDILLS